MPKEIWNEGRIVGLSAYEVYVKQHLAEDPTSTVATEKEWLASSIAMGSSLLLKVPSNAGNDRTDTFLDIQLPSNSNLAAANTIVASFFEGSAHFPDPDENNPWDQYWADRITSYGSLLSNTDTSSPSGITTEETPSEELPTGQVSSFSTEKQEQLMQYLNIIDGVVIQPGEWIASENQPPEKDFIPDLSNTHPRVRLHIRGQVTRSPLILLTGFTINSVLCGTTGSEGSTNTNHPENGDFLGPEDFPWASKIVFSVPNSFINRMITRSYSRNLQTFVRNAQTGTTSRTTKREVIEDTPIVDMRSCNPENYYKNYYSYGLYSTNDDSPEESFNLDTPITIGRTNSVLTVYQRSVDYPPALFGSFVTADNYSYLNPLDIVAPGSIKMFYGRDMSQESVDQHRNRLVDYEETYPGTHAFNLNTSGKIQYVFNNQVMTLSNNGDVTISEDRLTTTSSDKFTTPIGELTSTSGTGSTDDRPKLIKISVNNQSGLALLFSKSISTSPDKIDISSYPSTSKLIPHDNAYDNLSWSSLIYALRKNVSIDLLGDRLKTAKYSLNKPTENNSDQNWWAEDLYDNTKGSAHLRIGPAGSTRWLCMSEAMPNYKYPPNGSIGFGWREHATVFFNSDGSGADDDFSEQHSKRYAYMRTGQYHPTTPNDQVKNTSNWTPLFGGEYVQGMISPYDSPSTSEYPNVVKVYMKYGLIIFGRSLPKSIQNLRDIYATGDQGLGEMILPSIVYIDPFGGILWISKSKRITDPLDPTDPNKKVDMFSVYIPDDPKAGAYDANGILQYVVLRNNSRASSGGSYVANYMVLGDIDPYQIKDPTVSNSN